MERNHHLLHCTKDPQRDVQSLPENSMPPPPQLTPKDQVKEFLEMKKNEVFQMETFLDVTTECTRHCNERDLSQTAQKLLKFFKEEMIQIKVLIKARNQSQKTTSSASG